MGHFSSRNRYYSLITIASVAILRDMEEDMARDYEASHPWITFQIDLRPASQEFWIALGEAQSKCEHIARVPLRPDVADELHQVYLAKGIRATTAIEGNTLTEREVRDQIEGKLKLPKSREYLGREVTNILHAANAILDEIEELGPQPLTMDTLTRFNRMVLKKLTLDEGTIPGAIRTYPAGVGAYRCAPHQDCEYPLARLCKWLNGPDFEPRPGYEVVYGIIKSIVAHVYFVWIHPFGDGNGRTARLIEVKFLLAAGVPSAAAHLLSNHYNLTRSEYYRQLDQASKTGGNNIPFIQYAVQGFVDQLREQINVIKYQQWQTSWLNYVHDVFDNPTTPAQRRQLRLVLGLSRDGGVVEKREITRLTPELAENYAGKTPKTVTRDLNALLKRELIVRKEGGYQAKMEKILAFLPRGKRGSDVETEVQIKEDDSGQLSLLF